MACRRRLLARRARHQQPLDRGGAGEPRARMGLPPLPGGPDGGVRRPSAGILDRHGISPHRVLAHSDVAPARKEDPGELFDWRGLAARGIGLWPEPDARDDGPGYAVAEAQDLLARFGYDVAASGVLDAPTRIAATAFQRHFIPDRVAFGLDRTFMRVLRAAVRQAEALASR